MPGSGLLLNALAVLATRGFVAAAAPLKAAVTAVCEQSMRDEHALRWLWLACRAARALGEHEAWDQLTQRHVQLARRQGALAALPLALMERSAVQLSCGDLAAATALLSEADAVVQATGAQGLSCAGIGLAAWRGDETQALALIEAERQDVIARGEGRWLDAADWAGALLFNGLGRYGEALAAAERAAERPDEPGDLCVASAAPDCSLGLAELIEAAVRSGHPDRAGAPLRRLNEIARASGTDWALGLDACCRAVLARHEIAEGIYREALHLLGRTPVRIAVARAHLLYGEWLRRHRRRDEARTQLRNAHELFRVMGADGFAARARRELLATGESVRVEPTRPTGELTAQEAQIARLAVAGNTNAQIGAQLFLSPRTVEWHLSKIYSKLSVRSRRGLKDALG